jgi:phosphocarrier protein
VLEQTVVIRNKIGLHARPAALLVKTASGFSCEIMLVKGEKIVNAKSMLAIMSAGIKQNDIISVRVDGEKEAQALEAVVALINSGFSE